MKIVGEIRDNGSDLRISSCRRLDLEKVVNVELFLELGDFSQLGLLKFRDFRREAAEFDLVE